MPGPKGQERSSILWWLLGPITCGIGSIYWMWKTTSELKEFTQSEEINPMMVVILACVLPGIGPIFHAYKMGGWIDTARQSIGLPPEGKQTKYAIFVFILGLSTKMIQDDLNALWQAAGGGAA